MFMTKIKINKDYNVPMITNRELIAMNSSYQAGRAPECIPGILEERFGQLPKHKAELALIKLVAKSKRKTIKMEHTCECGKSNAFEINPDEIRISDETVLEHRVGQVLIKLRYPTLFEDLDHFDMLDKCIVAIEADGQSVSWAEANMNEKDSVFRLLTADDVTKMIKILLEPTLYIGVPSVCECGETSAAWVYGSNDILVALGVK